jgi:ATP-dependent protease HslVU (ClpYQ) peptidase subunit
MTVGIVRSCENGRYVVVACDAALSYGNQVADVGAVKMMWFGDWCFLFAGQLSSTEMTMESVRHADTKSDSALTRENICETVREAYRKHSEQWSAIRHLAPFGLNMSDFLQKGRKFLGSKVAESLSSAIREDYLQNFHDEILVVGWGFSPRAATIYSISPSGDQLHGKDGLAAIGSGAEAALSTLMLLGHDASSSLEHAVYAVAAAKFSSEGHGIGRDTRMWIGRKRLSTDSASDTPGTMLNPDEIESLRGIWEKYGKPRIPSEADDVIQKMTARLSDGEIEKRRSIKNMTDHINRG